jgi:hypothetical protein
VPLVGQRVAAGVPAHVGVGLSSDIATGTSRSFAGALVDANQGCSRQPVRWLIRLKIAASRLYGPAPAEMTTINMNAYKVSGK